MNDNTEKTAENATQPAAAPAAEASAQQAPEQATVKEEIHGELESWQTKIDEAKVQMHLGANEVEQKLQPHVDELEQEFAKAKAEWDKFEDASDNAWEEIQSGVSKSIKSMQIAFEKAKQHFPDDDKE